MKRERQRDECSLCDEISEAGGEVGLADAGGGDVEDEGLPVGAVRCGLVTV